MDTSISKQSNEQRYYDVLKRIAHLYRSAEGVIKNSEKDWGLQDGYEALEYTYENIQDEARQAIRGKRRPKS